MICLCIASSAAFYDLLITSLHFFMEVFTIICSSRVESSNPSIDYIYDLYTEFGYEYPICPFLPFPCIFGPNSIVFHNS